MNKNYLLLQKMKKWPCGLWLFSKAICFQAPYFSTIKPKFTKLERGVGEAVLHKRRAVQNHIGTVHAIAMANLCEFVGGATLEISLPPTHRWIPKGMNIQYLAKAETDLVAQTRFPLDKWPDSGSFPVHIDVIDKNGKVVVVADIEMHVSLKK
jgi:acyl-coenzyme A thioesterase PaaI-like protein